MDMLRSKQIAEAGLADWRKLAQGLHARYLVGDFGAATRFVAAVGQAGDAIGHHPRVAIGRGHVDLELVSDDAHARYWATLGFAFALCAVPVYILKGSIAAALVGVVGRGLDPVALFRVYDLAYNGAIYPLEAAYVLGLGWAIATMAGGWFRWLTIAVAGLQLLNTLVLFAALPPAVAMMKLVSATQAQETNAFLMDLDEFDGLFSSAGQDRDGIFYEYLWSAAMRIAGGADEVLRNQLAERALGMPGEMRADKGVPFNELPH